MLRQNSSGHRNFWKLSNSHFLWLEHTQEPQSFWLENMNRLLVDDEPPGRRRWAIWLNILRFTNVLVEKHIEIGLCIFATWERFLHVLVLWSGILCCDVAAFDLDILKQTLLEMHRESRGQHRRCLDSIAALRADAGVGICMLRGISLLSAN